MRVLLDECVPRPIKACLPGHDVHTVQQAGWSGKRNGVLMQLLSEAQFAVLVTTDRSMPHQQNLANARFAIIVLKGLSNSLTDLRPLAERILGTLESIAPGQIVIIE